MLTVSQAARRARRDPETVRRWIRTGRLRARKIGTQHFSEEQDLESLFGDEMLPLPRAWRRMSSGSPQPNW
jgi:excisionase family DNA binding protein